MATIKLNVAANFAGVAYTSIVSLVVLPLYLNYLGAEAYGLVGFFTLMQAWLQILDLGLSPTLARQVAVARGKVGGFQEFVKVLRNFEIIFLVISTSVVVLIVLSSAWIGNHWIKAEVLDSETISYCISIMGLLLGFRVFSSLYRSGINGIEDQVWLNIILISIVTLKFFGALLLLAFFTNDIEHFFEYQLVIGIIEVLILVSRFYFIAPIRGLGYGVKFDYPSLKPLAPFALGIAYSSALWIVITQMDKLILSGILSLAEFGYFSIVVLIAGAVMTLSNPIMQAVLPRLTVFFSSGELTQMYSLYRTSSKVVAVMIIPATFVIALYSNELLFAWTGDRALASWGGNALQWFVLGYGLLALSAFQYYLQNAFGDLRLHIIGSTISAFIQIPLLYYAAVHYGAEGVGMVWFAIRLIWFLWWMPVVHYKFMPGQHLSWLFKDILPVFTVSLLTVLIMYYLMPMYEGVGRMQIFLSVSIVGLVALSVSVLTLDNIRHLIIKKITN